ncbi:MAG: hypothetical protein BWX82_00669 [Parcubacteria group bacterium ADurb.Bin115]|nr:MAG: hypothetical protein BWX82_00669 [Parcubacteria group bacterium ADurb.Bin115]
MGGNVILGVSSDEIEKSDDSRFFDFLYIFQFHFGSGLKESFGCMTIRLQGWGKKSQSIFIPVNVKFFNPDGGLSGKIKRRHKKVGSLVEKYERDSVVYDKKMSKIYQSRQKKSYINDEKDDQTQYVIPFDNDRWQMLEGLLGVFEESGEEVPKKYTFSKEDLAEEKLKKKYKNLIEWRGPLCGGTIGNMDGFQFTVYSNDHGGHFHVIHKGRRVDARFSFPDIKLISYKSKNYISSKEAVKIADYFKLPQNFKVLEDEFKRRESALK